MATTIDLSKLVSYAVVSASGPSVSKIVSYAVLGPNKVVVNAAIGDVTLQAYVKGIDFDLNEAISNLEISAAGTVVVRIVALRDGLDDVIDPITINAAAEVGIHSHAIVDATIDDVTLETEVLVNSLNAVVNVTVGAVTGNLVGQLPIGMRVDRALSITPYVHFVLTPIPVASLDPFHDPVWVAVEFDLYDENDDLITLRLGNRGTIKRTVGGTLYQYDPRLSEMPILLGTTITVTSYGSPVRTQPNGGRIKFAIDEAIYGWFVYRWIGQRFRVYAGQSVDPIQTDVDDDLTLVYVGRIQNIKHDTSEMTVETTDETIKWDDPLVTDFYSNTFAIESLREKPRPYLWGYGFSIEPVLEDEATQTYGVSYRTGGLDFISEVRVGGVPWNLNSVGPPIQGEWTPDLVNGRFSLGSPTLGMDVRCDAQQGSFTVAGIIRSVIELANGEVDDDSMAALDTAMPGKVSLATSTSPVNRLDAIDDVVTNSGCWWGCGPLGTAIGGVIDVPALRGSLLLDETNIKSIELNAVHAPAWRIRVGYQRNWAPETSFATSILQADQDKWSADSQVFSPKYENNTIKDLEPLAVDVPLLKGSFVDSNDAHTTQQRLVTAWGTVRSLFDVVAEVSPEDINLYDTVAVNYLMVTGQFRITSAIRSIGGGNPATLQLWGTIGPYATEPVLPPVVPPVVPPEIIDMGMWARTSAGSGSFVIGTDTPSTVTSLWYRGVGGGGGGGGSIISGSNFYAGGGGASGGYFESVITVTAGQSISWSVGGGGSGGVAGSFGQAATGGSTTFGASTGSGGTGGTVALGGVAGGVGGGASGATLAMAGGPGGTGYIRLTTDSFDPYTSFGGASVFGGGGQAGDGGGAPGSGGGGRVGGPGSEAGL